MLKFLGDHSMWFSITPVIHEFVGHLFGLITIVYRGPHLVDAHGLCVFFSPLDFGGKLTNSYG